MLLVVNSDANRGVGFAGKKFIIPNAIKKEIEQIKKQIPDIELVNYNEFNGDWTLIDTVIIFSNNKVYPADDFFKFPANYRYLISNFINFVNDDTVYSAEIFKRSVKNE